MASRPLADQHGREMNLADYLKLWRVGRNRLQSEDAYREFQAFQASLLLDYLCAFGIRLKGRRVLDLGSGIGGYSEEMARQGARVISLDLIKPSRLTKGASPVMANALCSPLRDESADFVFCASLIEHVANPTGLLKEIRRVLITGKCCYLSFPPFYSPLGGHEFSPFHYLGERWALRLKGEGDRNPEWVDRLYDVCSKPQSFSETYEDWGLFKMTVAGARRLIKSSRLEIVDMSTRFMPVSLIRWPVLGEVFTWHAQFLLKKPA